jgi:hypothetical protein
MSLIITLHTREGIVMASDSRISITHTRIENGKTIVDQSISQSDNNYKTFLTPSKIGISMFGASTVEGGIPISGFIETFIDEQLSSRETDTDEVPHKLADFFKVMSKIPDTGFHVAGYKTSGKQYVQKVWRVFALNSQIIEIVPKTQELGAIWDGEQDILTRIINHRIQILDENNSATLMPAFGIPFEMFTLQDAIEFAIYAIKTTADTMRFQLRNKTVGGPIDVLVIKPNDAFWVNRKELHV